MVKRIIYIVKHLDAGEFNDLDVFATDWVFFCGEQEVCEVD